MRALDIVDPKVETYMASLLARRDEPVLLEMEAEAERDGFPIIGRLVGATVEVLARSAGARPGVQLRSGYGHSAHGPARGRRIRVGGLYLWDTVLWYGRVTEPEPERADTRAILEHNALVAEDERYLSAI